MRHADQSTNHDFLIGIFITPLLGFMSEFGVLRTSQAELTPITGLIYSR